MARPYPSKIPPELWDAAIAVTRFGYGAVPGQMEQVAVDPREWLIAQINEPPTLPEILQGLPPSNSTTTGFLAAQSLGPDALRGFRQNAAQQAQTEAEVHTAFALTTASPFRERLVRFWCNFFAISDASARISPIAHAFEREVIRPHLNGTLVQLLTEAMRHPAMLLNFDNARSVGGYSLTGLKGAPGVNDAMARGIMQNYTLGPDAEISRKDINGLAHMLTGWSVAGTGDPNPGGFLFRPNWHQPNKKLFQNRYYPEAGVLEAEAAIDTLGHKEETARHVATRMAQYFVDFQPPPDLIDDMLDGFTSRGNSLTGMAEGMVRSAAAWNPRQLKAKTPEDLVFSTGRALGWGPESARLALHSLRVLGQAPKQYPFPTGWPDTVAAWLSPQQLQERLAWGAGAAAHGGRWGSDVPVPELGLAILGPLLTPATYRRLVVTDGSTAALALLFAAPEFQRR